MNRFIIEEDGSIYKESVTKTPIDVLSAIQAAFQSNAVVRVAGILDFSVLGEPFFGLANITQSTSKPDTQWWAVRISTLNLNTTFEVKNEKLHPIFHNDSGELLTIPWKVPEDIRLVLGITVNGGPGCFQSGKHYLIAYDSGGRRFRIPISNLYDHCELCHGQKQEPHPTSLKAVMTSIAQFRSSLWNKDLIGDFQVNNAPKFFQFKAVNSGFEQLPIEGDWTRCCQKVSNDILNNFIP